MQVRVRLVGAERMLGSARFGSAQDNSVRNEKLLRVAGEDDGEWHRDGDGEVRDRGGLENDITMTRRTSKYRVL